MDDQPNISSYPNTQWTQIIEIFQKGDAEAASRALAEFCVQYRPAIFSFFRQRGCDPDDAEDHTQEFFETRILNHLDKRDSFLRAAQRREPGKFRSFLASYLWWFIKDKWNERWDQPCAAKVVIECCKPTLS